MRKLSVMPQDKSLAKQELRRRIALSNRPHLKVGMARLGAVSSVLARSGPDRAQFMENPTWYLKGQALPVSSCNVKAISPAQISKGEVLDTTVSERVDFGVACDCALRALVIGYQKEETIAELKQGSMVL
jgi:hypothetical protein